MYPDVQMMLAILEQGSCLAVCLQEEHHSMICHGLGLQTRARQLLSPWSDAGGITEHGETIDRCGGGTSKTSDRRGGVRTACCMHSQHRIDSRLGVARYERLIFYWTVT